jgi:WD40 repeat protein
MSSSGSGVDPLGQLAEDFLRRHRRGERPSPSEYAARHPELAEQIRELFPALLMMEGVRPEPVPLRGAPLKHVPPLRLGEYRIVREIGRGGMGVVYEAEQESLGRRVALKVLPPGSLGDARHVERFQREARAAARLHHTNIVPVFAVGEEGGTHYYAMQYIEGRPLDDVLRELRKLRAAADLAAAPTSEVVIPDEPAGQPDAPSSADVARSLWQGSFRSAGPAEGGPAAEPAAAPPTPPAPRPPGSGPAPSSSPLSNPDSPFAKSVAHIGVQVAEALEYAAGQGVLHRDVKPANLLLDVWGNVWLTDFGLAKATGTPDLTRTGDLVGTLRYLAPERFEGRADLRSDVYALGLTLYEMLSLRPAFEGRNQAELVRQITTTDAPRLDRLDPALPRDLVTVVHKATAREAADRYQTAAALAEDLRRFLDDRNILARRAGLLEQAWRWCRRNRALAASLAATVVALVAGLAFSLRFALGENEARKKADRREQDARGSEARARESARAARREVEKLHVGTGHLQEENGDLFGALLWLTRPLADEHTPAVDEAMHRLRLGCYFRHARRPTLVQVMDQQDPIHCAIFSPDGRRILTGGRQGAVQVWEAASGRRLATLRHEGTVWHVEFSPDGRTVLTASSDQTARLWDAATGRQLFILQHVANVHYAAFSPDGRSVVTACNDKTARVWDVATGTELRPPLSHRQPVALALFSPDGRWILTGTNDAVARVLLWDAKEPRDRADVVLEYTGDPRTSLMSVAFSHDSQRVAVTDQSRSMQVWDVATRKRTVFLKLPSIPNCAAFSPDDRRLATAEVGGTVHIWDATTGDPSHVVLQQRDPVKRVAFSPDGTRVVTGGSYGTARVWDAFSGEALTPSLSHHGKEVMDVAFSPDGDRFLTASEDGTARLWDMTSEGTFARVLTHRRAVNEASFSPDGGRVVTASSDGTAQVWDAATGRPITPPVVHEHLANHAAFSPDGRRVVSTGGDGMVRVWDAATGEDLTRPFRHSHVIRSASFSPDGRSIATAGSDGTARVWDAATGELRFPPLKHRREVRAAVFSPDGRQIVTACDDATARLWDAATGQPVGAPLNHSEDVNCAAFSPDGSRLVTGGKCNDGTWSGEAHVWDVGSGRPVWSVRIAGMVNFVAFSPDGGSVVVAGYSGTGRVYDAATGRPVSPAWTHGMLVTQVALSPDGRFVATSGADMTARVWEAATGQPVTPPLRHRGQVSGVSFSPDGGTLLTFSQDATARLWDLVPDDRPAADLVLLAQLLAGQRLDAQGALDPLSPEEQVDALAQLRRKYPAEFEVTPEQVMAWHRLQANRWSQLGNADAALFHHLRGSPVWPVPAGLPLMR